MSATGFLVLLIVSIAILMVLIMKVKLHPTFALFLSALFMGLVLGRFEAEGFGFTDILTTITGGFGGRDAPCPGASTYHLGVDIGASWGSDIYATKAGTVKVANEGWNYGLGYCVKIQHDDGTSTVYGHMSRVIAVVGQRVAQGQVIGKIGSTGVSTGPHLHYEIRIGGVNGTAVNPLPYLPGYVRYGW